MKGKPLSNHKEDMEKQEIKMMISNLREEMTRSNNFMLGEINLSNALMLGEMKRLEQFVMNMISAN